MAEVTAIRLAKYEPGWAAQFARQAGRIRKALGARALALEHVGSTSVAGLAAKPVLDILLVVEDSSAEEAYAPRLEKAGYRLRIREPGWHQHRMLVRARPAVNLHVFSRGCPECDRMVAFRDQLRRVPNDRELYESTKRALARQSWASVDAYAEAKTAVVEAILARAAAEATV